MLARGATNHDLEGQRMKWHKLGRIFEPKGQYPWCLTHGMLPTPLHLHDALYRVYFSGRDWQNRSHIGYVDIDLSKPTEIMGMSVAPVLSPGLLGTFDDSGVSPLCAMWDKDNEGISYVRLFYMGWHKDGTTRASEMTGRAWAYMVDGPFKASPIPYLDRTNSEPYSIRVLSSVLKDGNIWRGWYDSCDGWISPQLPRYNIKYIESDYLFGFTRYRAKGQVSVDYQYPNETRISRASVIKQDRYRMWYCYAIGEGGYHMGYGESEDGIKFTRMDDKAGIDVSPDGWDSEMVCYPSVFEHKGQLWLLYCGNGYGRTGFGICAEE